MANKLTCKMEQEKSMKCIMRNYTNSGVNEFQSSDVQFDAFQGHSLEVLFMRINTIIGNVAGLPYQHGYEESHGDSH